MNTSRRLTDCLRRAKKLKDVIDINDDTRLIFFSDIHRGDNSLTDEFAHNQNVYYHALSHYLKQGFKYIEVGDGDELWEYGSFENIRSAHSDVYCLLKEFYDANAFEYLFGNHNMAMAHPLVSKHLLTHFFDDYLDIDMPLFPKIRTKEAMILRDKKSKKKVLVVHGHQGDFINDQGWIISLFLMKVFWRFMHMIGFRNPASPSKNRVKRHRIEKNFSKWILENNVGILCGHTHRPKLPDEGQAAYLNTGCCVHPRGITGIELIGRKFYLIYWSVKPDEDGSLYIHRKVMKGPIDFSELMM